jgi:tetratricopeptide (TPR) repeat protein
MASAAQPALELAPAASGEPVAQGPRTPPYSGRMAEVMSLIARGLTDEAMVKSLKWRNEAPGDVMALISLGEALEKRGNSALAARAYGSIIDLFPSRADMRRFASNRLDRLRKGIALATDSYAKAVEQRPDHLTGHRLLAYSLLRQMKVQQAFEVIEKALQRSYPGGRFASGERVLREDLGLIGAVWLAGRPQLKQKVEQRLTARGATLATTPSLRFVLTWETDANDVDLHIYDAAGNHAYFQATVMASGGEHYGDVTTGYGPECFAINGVAKAYPYKLEAHYYSRGPMGYGMGKVEIIEHDGHGNLRMDQRPFVVMNDGAFVGLGTLDANEIWDANLISVGHKSLTSPP